MEPVLLQALCRSLQSPTTTKRYTDAGLGLAFILFIQLLVIPAQVALNLHHVNLPTSILVMLLVAAVMTIASYFSKDVEPFYYKYFRGPTDFLGRHMPLGFVAYFILLIRDHVHNGKEIPRIIGVFAITTIIGYVASFLCASGCFHVEQRLRRSKPKTNDMESNNKQPSPSIAWPAPPIPDSRTDPAAPLNNDNAIRNTLLQTKHIPQTKTASAIDFFLRTAPVWICIALITVVGIPVYFATGYLMPFEVFVFILFWTTSIQFQRTLRSSHFIFQLPRLRSSLIILANPILITWALGTAYMFAKKACTGNDMASIISEFRHNGSLSSCILEILRSGNNTPDIRPYLGAGDLASPLLDAGVACMGLKMYEYRAELWASLGTVSITCITLAAIGVFGNVLVGYGLGLPPADAFAFASRSATLALGIPAIENLGGSATLTSATAVFSGVLFQMVGDWVFALLKVDHHGKKKENRHGEDWIVVAAGVTVGINAAAIGTAHLIERDSRATAYSALAMIMFGAAIVAITSVPGVAGFAMSWWTR
ncbi:hypothetical protein GGS20DRAFT_446041 [Poronia punctata]|nr:hypothetical protein GGS20DRAFT_446041 [Poronia punctata]